MEILDFDINLQQTELIRSDFFSPSLTLETK